MSAQPHKKFIQYIETEHEHYALPGMHAKIFEWLRKHFEGEPQNLEAEFTVCWKLWPRKKGKKQAGITFEKLRKKGELPTWQELLATISIQMDHGMVDKGQYTPHFSTWLNDARWDDEISDDDAYEKQKEVPW